MTLRKHSLRGLRVPASLVLLLAAMPVQSEAIDYTEVPLSKLVNGQSIRIKQLSSTDQAVDNVQVLIVGWCDENSLTSILASTANRPILTVADMDVFEVEGAIISLFRKGTRQKFGIDRQAASRAGLILSSQLLQIAAVVN